MAIVVCWLIGHRWRRAPQGWLAVYELRGRVVGFCERCHQHHALKQSDIDEAEA